tara:strand:+ start:531 stop:1187 length:657 start_codon:yes stop_codon:yes gene_type:complete
MKLQAQKREAGVKLDQLRSSGSIPAVFYGKEEASTPISVNGSEFTRLYKEAGHSTIIDLAVEGESETKDILIGDIQTDPVTDEVLHVDLYVVTRGEAMETTVELEFVGEAPIAEEGAVIMRTMHEIDLRTMPRDLPSSIVVDLSTLTEIGQSIHVKDLNVPAGVEFLAEPDEIVATAAAQREEAEEDEDEESGEIDMSAIEVEKKGKAEEEGEESDKD